MGVCVAGRVSALAVSVSGNFKQQPHRVFVLYGFSMCGDESRSFLEKWCESPSDVEETLLEFLIRAESRNTWVTEVGGRKSLGARLTLCFGSRGSRLVSAVKI